MTSERLRITFYSWFTNTPDSWLDANPRGATKRDKIVNFKQRVSHKTAMNKIMMAT